MRVLSSLIVGLFVLLSPALDASVTVTRAEITRVLNLPGGRIDYNAATGLIAFDFYNASTLSFETYTRPLDGSATATCVSCGVFPANKNVGNPRFTPDGTHLILQVENNVGCAKADAHPGIGDCNDIYALNLATHVATLLDACEATIDCAQLYAQLDLEGDRIVYGVRTDASPSTFLMLLCDISFVGTPAISNCTDLAPMPADGFYEPQSFSNDGTGFFYSTVGDLDDTSIADMDGAFYNINTTANTKLMSTNGIWEEHFYQNRTTGKVAFISGQGNPGVLELDIWQCTPPLCNDRQRLTYFNEPGSKQYVETGITMAAPTWVDASHFLVYAIYSLQYPRPAANWLLEVSDRTIARPVPIWRAKGLAF